MSAVAIDFLQPRRAPALGWLLLALGVAALATALWFDRRWVLQRAAHEAAVREQQERTLAERRAVQRPLPLAPDQKRLQRVAPQLRQPWLPTLRLLENVTEPPVYLLGLTIDPATGTVKLDAEAPSFDHALSYLQLLNEDGLLGPAQLQSHQQAGDAARPSGVRFTAVTQWSAR
jgi:hypothetical protein